MAIFQAVLLGCESNSRRNFRTTKIQVILNPAKKIGILLVSSAKHAHSDNFDQSGNVMQVKILDHLIIGDNQHHSFADSAELVVYK